MGEGEGKAWSMIPSAYRPLTLLAHKSLGIMAQGLLWDYTLGFPQGGWGEGEPLLPLQEKRNP